MKLMTVTCDMRHCKNHLLTLSSGYRPEQGRNPGVINLCRLEQREACVVQIRSIKVCQQKI